MYCDQCGSEVAQQARYCAECGAAVTRPSAAAATALAPKSPSPEGPSEAFVNVADTEAAEFGKIYNLDVAAVSKFLRLGNVVVDTLVYFALSFAVGVLYGIFLVVTGNFDELDSAPGASNVLLGFATLLVYYIACEHFFSRTPGKLVTGSKVISDSGEKPTFGQIVGRTFARFIPFEPFSLLFSSTGEGWHDSLSGTRVVKFPRPTISLDSLLRAGE